MPANQTLTPRERSDLVALYYASPAPGPYAAWRGRTVDTHGLREAACWNWALNGGVGDIHAATSAQNLYMNVGKIILNGADAGNNREELLLADFPNIGPARFRRLNNAWKKGQKDIKWYTTGRRAARQKFLKRMMRYVARQNGFTVHNRSRNAGDHYAIAMVTKANTWQSWDHWALKIYDDNGRYVYAQKEPGHPLSVGFRRLWEADRANRITGEIIVTGLHAAQADVLRGLVPPPP